MRELCYQNNSKSLFRKYARLVTWFARLQNKDIALYLPHGYIEGKDNAYRLTAYSRPINAYKLYPALVAIDSLQYRLESFREAKEILYWYIAGGRMPSLLRKVHLNTETFNPDAHPETTSVDGYISRGGVNETFATIRGGAGTASDDSIGGAAGVPRITATSTTNQYSLLTRGVFLFDTSPLSDTATISSGTFSLNSAAKADGLTQSIGITSSNPASNTALANADYAVANFGSTKFATDKTIASITVNQYEDYDLNASGIAAISLVGITKFASRFASDIDNSAPTWVSVGDSFVTPVMADSPSNKPKLVVNFTVRDEDLAYFL
jgi:hypothetical protein